MAIAYDVFGDRHDISENLGLYKMRENFESLEEFIPDRSWEDVEKYHWNCTKCLKSNRKPLNLITYKVQNWKNHWMSSVICLLIGWKGYHFTFLANVATRKPTQSLASYQRLTQICWNPKHPRKGHFQIRFGCHHYCANSKATLPGSLNNENVI